MGNNSTRERIIVIIMSKKKIKSEAVNERKRAASERETRFSHVNIFIVPLISVVVI